MQQNEITVRETFTRDQLTGTKNPVGNEVLAGQVIFGRLRQKGVPVIGILGVLAVEWGTLTIAHDDGLDGDEWTFTWTGVPMPQKWIAHFNKPGVCMNLTFDLKAKIAAEAAEDDEL
jgi:hypothetical protein